MKKALAIYDYQNYRKFLQDHLQKTQEKNAGFSLRAYAAKLEVTPSYLSEVLSGKKNLSLKKAESMTAPLGFNDEEAQYFIELTQLGNTKSETARSLAKSRLVRIHRPIQRSHASESEFNLLSEWYLIPVLEMLVSQHFKNKPSEIGRTLGISEFQVNDAISRLEQIRVIKKDSTGHWVKTQGSVMLSSEKHNNDLKRFHNWLLERYQRAIYEQTPQERYTGSETALIDPKQIPEAQKIMNECLDKLLNLFSQSTERTEPYHLHFGMFSLRRKDKTI